jgi:hypothetical protein
LKPYQLHHHQCFIFILKKVAMAVSGGVVTAGNGDLATKNCCAYMNG